MTINFKDVASGLFFAGVGLLYGTIALRSLPVGSALNMGPGYFPLVLSGILVLVGLAVIVRSVFVVSLDGFGVLPWRAVVMITAAVLTFASTLPGLGMLPCVFATSLAACLSSPQIGILRAIAISAGVALFCTGIFVYGVKLPIPVIGAWLSS